MARPRKKKLTYDDLEAVYVAGDASIRELAEEYGLKLKVLHKHCHAGKWVEKRKRYREEIKIAKIERSKEESLRDKLFFDSMTDRVCNVMAAQIAVNLTLDHWEERRVPPSVLKDLSKTMQTLQELKYRRHDVPTPVHRMEHTRPQAPGADVEDEIAAVIDDMLAAHPDEFTDDNDRETGAEGD